MEFTLEALDIDMASVVIIRREGVKGLDGVLKGGSVERRTVGGREPTEPGV